jgi:Xaa-Pro aminopeptidase
VAHSEPSDHLKRVGLIRDRLREKRLDGYIVRGTDRFLNEYVPEDESLRIWLSGFTGSTGDLLITPNDAFLFVDGRYYLQADKEIDARSFHVVKVPLGVSLDKSLIQKLQELFPSENRRIGYSPEQFSVDTFNRLKIGTEKLSLEWIPLSPSPAEEARGPIKEKMGKLRKIDSSLTGLTTEQKLSALRDFMASHQITLWVMQALDEIAYLTNLRGEELPYQATFKSLALVTPDRCYIALPKPKRTEHLDKKTLTFINMEKWEEFLSGLNKNLRAGFDPSTATEAVRLKLASLGIPYRAFPSPIGKMKSSKTPEELGHMIHSFQRADLVVHKAKTWLCKKITVGEPVTEALLSEKVAKLFKQSGALSLSFHIISAAGTNGAIIHYSQPDPKRVIQKGELILLDTGAYYEGGYATDLTRTFLAGDPKQKGTDEQRRIFTLVLKGAIAGMSAVFPKGTSGVALDTLVRAPLWEAGFNYNHGTGHGVGINVHESPPRISSQGDSLEKGQIFSIEPGIYISEFGGVRIENLCTVIDHPIFPDWLTVAPLTFSPFDDRLIEMSLLTPEEKKWLKWYKNQFRINHTSPPLPYHIDKG